MTEGITCYEQDETLCEDGMCLRCGCRLRNDRLSAQQREPVVRVSQLLWGEPYLNEIGESAISAHSSCGRYIASDHGWFLCGLTQWNEAENMDAAKSAAQADYEQRIMAAIEIAPQSDRQPLPGQKQISETGKELPENEEQPMNNADVSVGELAGFFATEFPPLMTMSTQIEVARALLARYRIERLDRLASGRR